MFYVHLKYGVVQQVYMFYVHLKYGVVQQVYMFYVHLKDGVVQQLYMFYVHLGLYNIYLQVCTALANAHSSRGFCHECCTDDFCNDVCHMPSQNTTVVHR